MSIQMNKLIILLNNKLFFYFKFQTIKMGYKKIKEKFPPTRRF